MLGRPQKHHPGIHPLPAIFDVDALDWYVKVWSLAGLNCRRLKKPELCRTTPFKFAQLYQQLHNCAQALCRNCLITCSTLYIRPILWFLCRSPSWSQPAQVARTFPRSTPFGLGDKKNERDNSWSAFGVIKQYPGIQPGTLQFNTALEVKKNEKVGPFWSFQERF